MNIFKIFRINEWEAFQLSGEFKGSLDDLRDGFIHFSSEYYLLGTMARYFKDQGQVVIARAANENWGEMMQWETSRGGGLFPHLYGSLYIKDITQSWRLHQKDGDAWDVSQIASDLKITFAPSDV